MGRRLQISVPKAFKPLLGASRYKGAHGGRGSGKSHFFADQLVIAGLRKPGFRAACIREVQRTLAQSVKRLIEDKIELHGLGSQFEVQEAVIKTPGGGVIIFQGMQNHTADSIKSLEGFDLAYVEEAQSLSQRSLDLLRPTIREEGSELWFAWNPRFDTDAVDLFFRGGARPPDAQVVEANWSDNPFFPDVLRREMEHDYAADPEKAAHIWGGGYEILTEGSYFARDLAAAEKEGRIGAFPYDPALPVITAWDIGVDDYTAIWFLQENGRRVRAIDYYETSGDGAQLIVHDAIRSKPYRYAKHYLPHDVTVREWGAGARSRIQTLRELGLSPVIVGVAQGPEERINAARRILPIVDFNAEKTSLGVKRLRNYRRRWSEPLQTFQGPLHDDNSHGADAFGEFAINCAIRPQPVEPPRKPRDKYDKDDDEDLVTWMTA
jgi:phage terminase large subunit